MAAQVESSGNREFGYLLICTCSVRIRHARLTSTIIALCTTLILLFFCPCDKEHLDSIAGTEFSSYQIVGQRNQAQFVVCQNSITNSLLVLDMKVAVLGKKMESRGTRTKFKNTSKRKKLSNYGSMNYSQ